MQRNRIWHNYCTMYLRITLYFKKDVGGLSKMNIETSCAERMVTERENTGLQKCDIYNRELKSSTEWVCSDHRIICDICYRNMLAPDRKIYFED